jgi:hypothetical protein
MGDSWTAVNSMSGPMPPQAVLVDFHVASDVQHASPVGGIKPVQGEIVAVMPPQMMSGPSMMMGIEKTSPSPSNRPHSSVERGQIEPWTPEEDSESGYKETLGNFEATLKCEACSMPFAPYSP